jgi:DNA repair protein RadC
MNNRALKKHLKYLVPQIRLALIKEPGVEPVPIRCPEDVEKFVEPLKHYSEEHFVAFHLDCNNNVIGYHVVSHGTLSASLVHPREVFKAALLANSHAILVAHNHPGGSRTASPDDIQTTKQLIAAAAVLQVPVVDHIIVTATSINSLREERPDLWP